MKKVVKDVFLNLIFNSEKDLHNLPNELPFFKKLKICS